MATFTYTFEELPLAIVGGIEAGLISGQAEINFTRCGNWEIHGITLEGFGHRVNGVRQWPQVEAPAAIAAIISSRLQTEWHGRVQDAVREQLEREREEAFA